jgi:aryl-alcohol dehydrogenase-like predicted oxidoreductase
MTAVIGLRSRVGLGTVPLGSRVEGPLWWGPQDPAEAIGAVRAALDAGLDWIDTAPFYEDATAVPSPRRRLLRDLDDDVSAGS